jgi:segregation and condensation protein B
MTESEVRDEPPGPPEESSGKARTRRRGARASVAARPEVAEIADVAEVAADAETLAAADGSAPQESPAEHAEVEESIAEAGEATAEIDADASDEAIAAAAGSDDETAAAANEPDFVPLDDRELERVVEALLFASHEPLTAARLAQVLRVTGRKVRSAIERLREDYLSNGRAFDVSEIAGGYKLYTRPEYLEYVALLEKVKPPEKLSASALETLAIIAYRQPIVRAEIDSIRGVQSGAILKALAERKLIRVVGRSEQPGRPLQYGTTKRFLDHFGLASVEDLPRVEDLKAP